MAKRPESISLYATRWKRLVLALPWIVVYLLLLGPALADTQKTIFIIATIILGPFILYTLYWVVTPLPALKISASELVFRSYFKRTVKIAWKDVESASASFWRRTRFRAPDADTFTLSVDFKPNMLASEGGRRHQTIDIDLGTFSKSSDELLQIIRTYHPVEWHGK